MKSTLKDFWALIKETLNQWIDDNATSRAASLAYYTVFSIAPMLLIAIAVAGAIFGEEAARGEIHRQLQGLVGDSGSKVIEDMLENAGKPGSGLIATVIGVAVLLFAATGVFAELQDTLNAFWKAPKRQMNGVLSFLRTRFVSFAMVLGIGFLLLVSLVLSAGISAIGSLVNEYTTEWTTVAQVINQLLTFGVVTLLFALMYKYLPDRKVAWKDVWLGALVTSVLFNLGKLAIGLYIAKSTVASSYGAAGSLAVLLVWVYYSSLILFVGAEFTQVYANMFGSLKNKPDPKQTLEKKKEEKHSWPPAHTPVFPGTARSSGGR